MPKEFIVAIELGSSKMTGIAGKKNLDGSIQVLSANWRNNSGHPSHRCMWVSAVSLYALFAMSLPRNCLPILLSRRIWLSN